MSASQSFANPTALSLSPNATSLYVMGRDGQLWSNFFPSGAGYQHWFGWFPLGGYTFPVNAPIAAVSTGPNETSLYVVGADGQVWTNFYPGANNSWSGWMALGPNVFPPGAAIVALSLAPNATSLYVMGIDGQVWSNFFPAGADGNEWFGWFPLGGHTFSTSASVTAVSTGPNATSLYVVGTEGQVWTNFYPGANNSWSGWMALGPNVFPPGAAIAALSLAPNATSLYVMGIDGQVWSNFFPAGADGKEWFGWFPLGGHTFSTSASVTAVSTGPNATSLYVVGTEGQVWTNFYPGANNNWSGWIALGLNVFPQGATVSAISTLPGATSLYIMGLDGQVWTNFFIPGANNNNWSGWNISDYWGVIKNVPGLAWGGLPPFPAIPLSAPPDAPTSIGSEPGLPTPENGVSHGAIVGLDGHLYLTSSAGFNDWSEPLPIGTSFAPAGANVALGTKWLVSSANANWLPNAFAVVANSGFINMFTEKEDRSGFNGPNPIGSSGLFPPGGGIAASLQTNTVFTVVAVGNDGHLYVAWENQDSGPSYSGSWNGPIAVGNAFAPPGAKIALNSDTGALGNLSALVVGSDARLWVASISGPGPWSAPSPIGDPVAPSGSSVAKHGATAVVLGNDGRFWVANATKPGVWTAPTPVGDPFGPPGGCVALSSRGDGTLVALACGTDGRLWTMNRSGETWSAPVPFGFEFGKPGGPVSLSTQFGTNGSRVGVMALGNDGQLHFAYEDGAFAWSDPLAIKLSNTITQGSVRPRYLVMTILYAPPGMAGGKGQSLVDYSQSEATETNNSVSDSFKETGDVSLMLGSKDQTGGGVDFSFSPSKTDNKSLDIKTNTSKEIKVPGPGSDGINHDYDIVSLWLNPSVDMTVDGWGNVQWNLTADGAEMDTFEVYFGYLRNPATMPASVLQVLNDAGLTQADYQEILALNPFATGSVDVDPQRFKDLGHTFTYAPPMTAADQPPTETDGTILTTTTANSTSFELQYTVVISVSASFFGILHVGASDTMQWTNSSTVTDTDTKVQSASVTIGGPAFGYNGPLQVKVYLDTVYNTFLFAF